MEEKLTVGKFIARKRKERGFTQRDLADRLYVTESAVSKWERGLSYPDITLVRDLCGALEISEHELLSADEDRSRRAIERQAKTYRTMKKSTLWTLNILYAAAILTCFIVNLAVDHGLTWFFLVFTGVLTGFSVTSLPLMLTKNRGLWTLCAFVGSLLLLLFTSERYTGGDWLPVTAVSLLFGLVVVFLPLVLRCVALPWGLSRHRTLLCFAVDTLLLFPLLYMACSYAGYGAEFYTVACPVALFTLPLAWGMMLAIRYLKIDGLFRTAVCLVLAGGYTLAANSVIAMIINRVPFQWPLWDLWRWTPDTISGNVVLLTALSCALLALVFTVGGVAATVRKRTA